MIESSIKKTEAGFRICETSVSSFDKIVSSIDQTASLIEQINTASREEAEWVAQVNQGLLQIAAVVQSNTSIS